MNRLVLIGNGFDKAHGLPTSYNEFMDNYWSKVPRGLRKIYEDEFINIKFTVNGYTTITSLSNMSSYEIFQEFIKKNKDTVRVMFKNKLWERLSNASIKNWVDVENEYYLELLAILNIDDRHAQNNCLDMLNRDFRSIRNALEDYLSKKCNSEVENCAEIESKITSSCIKEEIVLSSHQALGDILMPQNIILLNFNYTNTVSQYIKNNDKIKLINIHGQLNDKNNPIIFGYGDELDDNYKKIENMNNNRYLEYIKSMSYGMTDNYRKLLEFITSDLYQIVIMGHSCGNSDRTLLNTLFEHDNCVSIKPYYYQIDKENDNYSDIYQNISRNFNNKQLLRERVVNKTYCEPLIKLQ